MKTRHDIPNLIFDKFTCGLANMNVLSNDFLPTSVAFRSSAFILALDCELYKQGIKKWRAGIDYDFKAADTYFIEPTPEYKELFYKRKKYEYQQEARWILPEISLNRSEDRFNIYIKIDDNDKRLVQGPPP